MKQKTQFGQLYRWYRERPGKEHLQEDMAKLTGKSPSYISKVEGGSINPPWDFLLKSMEVFGVTDPHEKEEFIAYAFASSKMIQFPISDNSILPKEILPKLLARLALNGTQSKKDDPWWGIVQHGIALMLNSWKQTMQFAKRSTEQ